MKKNKSFIIILLATLGLFIEINIVEADSDTISEIYSEITPGEFSMSTPNNLSFIAKLSEEKQSLSTKMIQMNVVDYRGIDNGWQIVVKSPNFKTYEPNYQLQINNEMVSDHSVVVYKNEKQLQRKSLELLSNIKLSKDAKAGSYIAELEWTLQPNIKNDIKE